MTARTWVTIGVVAGLVLVSAAPAAATTRYAGPTGDLDPDCTNQAAPCELQHAVETVAQNGDEVVALPGNYSLGVDKLEVSTVIDLHGAAGQPRPRLVTSAASYGVEVGADGAAIRHLAIEQIGSGVNGALSVRAMATAERLAVTSFGSSSDTACDIARGALLRDSVCRDTEDHGIGVGVGGADTSATLRNVTAVAQGTTGWGVLAFPGSGAEVTISAKNVIASGPEADVRSFAPGAGDTATVTLDHSNYATELEDGAGTATVTDPGSGSNQTAAPLFANAAGGDFHQRPASPTIDAGRIDFLVGPRDLDGQPRSQGAAPDIGADEFAVAPPSPPSDEHLTLEVDAKRKQKAARLKVTVSCAEEPCEAEIGGKAVAKKKRSEGKRAATAGKRKKGFKLKPKSLSLEAGERVTKRLKYKRNRGSVRKLKRLLKRKPYRERSKAKITVTATDAAGNTATEKLKVKLK